MPELYDSAWNWTLPEPMNQILDSIYNPIVAIDGLRRVVYCNLAAARLIAIPRKEIIGRDLLELVPTSYLHRVLKTGKAEVSLKFTMGDRTFLANQSVVGTAENIVGAVAILQDISDLESISTELKHTKMITEELNAIIESSFDGIFVADGQGVVLRVNRAYERITGLKQEELVDRPVQELLEEGMFDESATLRVLSSLRSETIMQTMRTGKTVMVTGNPIFDREGQIILVVANVRDVTELSLLQRELQKMDKLQSETEIELRELRESFQKNSKYVIRSKKMQELHKLGTRLAQVDSTVLILGESGVGKEIFAEMVHHNGRRHSKPFIKISCAAIPENLLESELFGYAPGAFTGAQKGGKAGIFEMAQGGSIFLDEIGEMPIGLQAKLLRVLQDKQFCRIGSTVAMTADVRIIAATNRDLEEMVEQNLFRRDLYFRLNVVPVLIPPLRERREAIINFVYHFLKKYNKKYGFNKQIDREVVDLLCAYDWPGNVRELENMIERIVVVSHEEIITVSGLPEHLRQVESLPNPQSFENKTLSEILEETERVVLQMAFEKHKTTRNIAKALGVNQSTVVRKLQRYQISAQ